MVKIVIKTGWSVCCYGRQAGRQGGKQAGRRTFVLLRCHVEQLERVVKHVFRDHFQEVFEHSNNKRFVKMAIPVIQFNGIPLLPRRVHTHIALFHEKFYK